MSQGSASLSEVCESLVVCGPVKFWFVFFLINFCCNVDQKCMNMHSSTSKRNDFIKTKLVDNTMIN